MLEGTGLRIRPWEVCADDPSGRRRGGRFRRRLIQNTAGDSTLGFVSCRRHWFAWLRRRKFEVYETEDASLLLTAWGPTWTSSTWEVRDAENRCRGLVHGTWLFNETGDGLALLDLPPGASSGKFIGPTGDELAAFHLRGAEGTRLYFTRDTSPFSRMVLLAAVLAFE